MPSHSHIALGYMSRMGHSVYSYTRPEVAWPAHSLQTTWTKRSMQHINFIFCILSGHANMSTFAAQAGDTDVLHFHAAVTLTQLTKLRQENSRNLCIANQHTGGNCISRTVGNPFKQACTQKIIQLGK